MTRKRRDRGSKAAEQLEEQYESLHIQDLLKLSGELEGLSFLKEKLPKLQEEFDLKKFLGYYHLAVMTVKDFLDEKEKENQLLRDECSKLRVRMEEFTIPSKALQVAPDREKEELKERIEDQQQLLADFEAKHEHLRSDFESFRRRTEKRLEEEAQAAGEKLILKFLPILDNMERALSFKDAADVESVIAGVGLIKRQIEEFFEKEGVERIRAAGLPFDPNVHEAAESIATSEVPEDTVLEEIRKGYRLGEKVIRPALVKVAKASLAKKEDC